MKAARKIDLDIIRIVAILLVIFNHTDGFIYYTETGNIMTWLFSLGMACICRVGVPLFFMVSGALLLSKDETIKELLCRRVSKIFIVLIIISIFYYVMDVCRHRIPNAGVNDFLEKFYTNGIRESLWFLYAYCGMLLTLPFFRIMIRHIDQRLMRYLFGLKIIFALILPLWKELFGFSISLDLGFVNDYIFYMILGYYMKFASTWQEKGYRFWQESVGFIGCVVFDMIIMQIHFLKTGNNSQELLDIFICIMAPLVFCMCGKIADRWRGNDRINIAIATVGQCVFGIYLLDNFVRWQLLPLYLFLSEKTIGVFANSIYVCGVFIIGFIYTAVLRKIPFIKRYL